MSRVCGKCEAICGNGPDPCLGYIPGVSHACCGHGRDSGAYVTIGGQPNESLLDMDLGADYLVLRGQDALDFFALAATATEKELATYPDLNEAKERVRAERDAQRPAA